MAADAILGAVVGLVIVVAGKLQLAEPRPGGGDHLRGVSLRPEEVCPAVAGIDLAKGQQLHTLGDLAIRRGIDRGGAGLESPGELDDFG